MANQVKLNIKGFEVLTEQKEDDDDFLVSTHRPGGEAKVVNRHHGMVQGW
jgi:hypothetical protein